MSSQVRSRTLWSHPHDLSDTAAYGPSFVDRLMDLIQRLPVPYWLTLLVLFVLQSALVHALAWIDGWLAAYTFSPLLLLFPGWLWGPIGIMIYLNSTSREAVSSFRPLLDIDDERLTRLKREFTTMPARSVVLSSVLWSILYAILWVVSYDTVSVGYGIGPLLIAALIVEGLVSFSIGSAIYYHSLRQLRLVNRTVQMVERVNLFELEPAYAFSRLTARTGVAWMILLSLSLLTYPVDATNAGNLAIYVLQVLLSLAAFVLPLRFVNHQLTAEKRRLVAELDQRVEQTLARLHRALDAGEMSGMDQLNDAVAVLNAERDILTKIPTWPWRAGTLPKFLSAVALPIVLFFVQLVIEKWLGG